MRWLVRTGFGIVAGGAVLLAAIHGRSAAQTPAGVDAAAPQPITAALTCQGSAFDPNPIAFSNDPDTIRHLDSLDSEVQAEPLAGVSPLDGVLRNDWFSLVSDSGAPYLQGATCDGLTFGWRDPRFAYVATFAALERARLWLSEIGVADVAPRNLEVHVSETLSVSRYEASMRRLTIGSRQCTTQGCACGADTAPCPLSADGRPIWPHAQDSDIVIHEYGHAVLHNLVCRGKPGCVLPTGPIVTAMDEGFADYLASAVNQSRSKEKNDPFCLGEWYNSFQRNPGLCLRRMDSDLHWPETARALRESLPYGYASIWASALFKARTVMPPAAMDRIVFDAYAGLVQDMSFEQMAARLVDAAARVDGGQYEPTLRSVLRHQGFLANLTPRVGSPGDPHTQEMALELDSGTMSAFPAFDHTEVITISGAHAIQLQFSRIRLKSGDCVDAWCGHLYIGDGNGKIYEVIQGVYDDYKTVVVPGETIALRFVASVDHPRTTIYRVRGVTVYGSRLN